MVLALATFTQLCLSLPQQVPAALGPLLTHDLGLSRAELGLLTSASWGGMLLGTFAWGVFADRRGEHLAIVLGGGVLVVALFVAAQATGFPLLFGAFLVGAIGAAGGGMGGIRAVTGWFEPARRALAIGIRQTGVTAAGLVDAVALPPIALRFGWQAAVRAVAVTIAAGLVIFGVFYREHPSAAPAQRGHFRLLSLASNQTWVAATAYAWVMMGALGCAVTYLVASLHQEAGIGLVQAGYLLGILQIGGITGRLAWGAVSDRVGARGPVMGLASALAVVSSLVMAALEHGGTPGVTLAVLALSLGVSCLGWNALYITLSAESVPTGYAATVIGAGTTISFTALFIAPPVFGAIADHSGSYVWSWLALAFWTLLGTAIAFAVRDRRGIFTSSDAAALP